MTYVVNRNINFTNVCYTGCRFCAFAQRRTDAGIGRVARQRTTEYGLPTPERVATARSQRGRSALTRSLVQVAR